MITAALDFPAGEAPWAEAVAIARRLRELGHQAFFVGGCVRDLLLGRAVHDVDLATDATPEQVEAGFPRTVAVGKSFGVVVVVTPSGGNVEVASFRKDGLYIDGRRPTAVVYSTAEEDVKRRDFTINALLLEPAQRQLIDHVGGLADIAARVLRAVGDPARRLAEDRLRVLRGLRFLAQLGLTAEPETAVALAATPLAGLSAERLMQEWFKGLAGPGRGRWLAALHSYGHLAALCPPLGDLDEAAVARHGARLDGLVDGDPADLAAALWLLPAAPTAASAWLEAQPLARDLAGRIRWLLDHGRDAASLLALAVPARRRLLQHPQAGSLARLAALQAAVGDVTPAIGRQLAESFAAERAAGPWRPLLRAGDLIALGFVQGPGLGRALRELEDAQLAGQVGDRDQARELAQQILARPTSR